MQATPEQAVMYALSSGTERAVRRASDNAALVAGVYGARKPFLGITRPVFTPWLDDGLPGSWFATESFSTMLWSVGFLVFEHDWRYSSGTRDGGCRTPGSLAWAWVVEGMGIGRVLGVDDGPAWRWGERGE